MKHPRKLVLIILSLCICLVLYACKSEDSNSGRVEDYDIGYEDGYHNGYDEGKMDGAFAFREYIADEIWAIYSDMEGQTSRERGLHPEEAIIALNNYLDGEYVPDEELRTAIESISYFYYHAWDVVADIGDMDIEFYD